MASVKAMHGILTLADMAQRSCFAQHRMLYSWSSPFLPPTQRLSCKDYRHLHAHLNTFRTCKHAVALYAARIDHISSPSYSTSRGTSVKALAVISRLSSCRGRVQKMTRSYIRAITADISIDPHAQPSYIHDVDSSCPLNGQSARARSQRGRI